jgi:acyl-CoA thioester hydrolase
LDKRRLDVIVFGAAEMRVPIEVRFTDYDMQGHINNAAYLTFFEIARHRAWVAMSGLATKIPFIMAEASVRYVSQARWGDPLTVEIVVAEIRTKAWVATYRVVTGSDDRLVAEGRTVQVMYDYDAQRSMAIPDDMRAMLLSLADKQ